MSAPGYLPTMKSYLPWQAAEVARLCCHYGCPEQIEAWLSEGYSPHEVESSLRTRNVPIEEIMTGMLSPKAGQGAAAAAVRPVPADDWAAARQANAERLAR
jgi:hypothetical protein